MKKIKETLIHWLGGYTETEYLRYGQSAFEDGISRGANDAKQELKRYADSLYGKNAKEWCEKMYECLTELNKE